VKDFLKNKYLYYVTCDCKIAPVNSKKVIRRLTHLQGIWIPQDLDLSHWNLIVNKSVAAAWHDYSNFDCLLLL